MKYVLFFPIRDGGQSHTLSFSTEQELSVEDVWIFEYYVLDSSGSEYRLVEKQTFKLTRSNIF